MIIAGTGHRPSSIGGFNDETTFKLLIVAFKALKVIKPELVITGMALGWDQALAKAAIGLKINFLAAIPFEGQEAVWPESSKIEYKNLLSHAKDVKVVCDKGYAPWKMQARNAWMVDNSDYLLALWNGSEGGTGNCVKYAISKDRLIINVWNDFLKENTPSL